eukprot:TRINITY_DN17031_c0_g1_i3.p1 TRINITY_DN17031_c0_g1~~TRINITY_DN17031_c0_g1_i3.p1  ORF type:complete len:235 (-),score=62.80 TRINITY_DN17031_c0_g1_i3:176-880(-)
MEFISPEGLRLDGRRPHELRQLKCEVGVLEKADGSAYFEMGNTKVKERSRALFDKGLVQCEYSMAAFSTGERRRRGKIDRRSKEISLIIKETLQAAILTELLPRTQIDIFVHVLQADGGTRSACINAAAMALCDAGVPMRDIVCSVGVGYLNATPLLDLNYAEDGGGGPDLTVGILPNVDKVTLLQMDSRVAMDVFEQLLDVSMKGCQAIAKYMHEVLLERTQYLAAVRGPAKM